MKTLALALLLGLGLGAQTLPPPQAAPSSKFPLKRVLLAAAAGATAGALIGTQGLSFAALPPSERSAHQWRAGLTYGAIGGVLAAAGAAALTPASTPAPHNFWWDQANTPLFLGIGLVQGLDYASTRYFRDRGKDEWLLTNSLVDNQPAFAATEIAAGAAGIGLSYLFHRAGHHHAERWVAAGWIALGLVSAVANYRYPATGHALF